MRVGVTLAAGPMDWRAVALESGPGLGVAEGGRKLISWINQEKE